MFHRFQISDEVFRALGLKMKILITVGFSSLLILSVMLLSFSDFKNQVLGTTINYSWESETVGDKLIGGLLTEDFNERSCVSRYHKSLLYRNPSPYKPSEYLISKLRSYEILHKRCGPGTKAYKEETKNLSHDKSNYANKTESGECKYIVWLADFGLGNRMLTLTSVFLYALLTERIILIDQSKDISDLFCEPFPGTSWLLPLDFPLMKYTNGYNKGYSQCYGTMLEKNTINSTSIPRHLYLHMIHDSRDIDKMFVCEKDQSLIDKVPWLIFRANVYFVPSLWFNPSFNTELTKLFPQKETVFHHLARYLFHPTNRVWDIITKYYNVHLSKPDERLGIQVRTFNGKAGYHQNVMDQVISCTQREKLLPKEESKVNISKSNSRKHLKAVLVTSLYPEYSEKLKKMILEQPRSTREVIEVYQPSGERVQQTDKKFHDQQALAEMYLLSLTDNIVTSARSTFGYVAHSLGGLKPWLLHQPKDDLTIPDPPCVRSTSMEPCFLTPPGFGCSADSGTHSWQVLPFVRFCEDIYGIKLFDEL